MISYLEAPVAHEALFKKYASKKFLKGEIRVEFKNRPMLIYGSIDHVAKVGQGLWHQPPKW